MQSLKALLIVFVALFALQAIAVDHCATASDHTDCAVTSDSSCSTDDGHPDHNSSPNGHCQACTHINACISTYSTSFSLVSLVEELLVANRSFVFTRITSDLFRPPLA